MVLLHLSYTSSQTLTTAPIPTTTLTSVLPGHTSATLKVAFLFPLLPCVLCQILTRLHYLPQDSQIQAPGILLVLTYRKLGHAQQHGTLLCLTLVTAQLASSASWTLCVSEQLVVFGQPPSSILQHTCSYQNVLIHLAFSPLHN